MTRPLCGHLLQVATCATVLATLSHAQPCDPIALLGDTVTVPLGYSAPKVDNQLAWKHKTETIFWRKKGKVITGQEGDVSSDGSLVLRSMTMDQSGPYSAEVFNSDGKQVHSVEKRLCVTETVSKPNVTKCCSETQCTLTCVGQETKHTKYSWKVNGESVNEGNEKLLVEKTGDQSKSYSCVFSNPKSEKDSDPVTEMDLFPEPVSKPNVTASCSETQCTLTCVGEETKHTKYSWKENDETVKEGNILTVEKTGEQSKSYTCVFSNPKSEEHSDPLTEMDLFPRVSTGLVTVVVVGVAEVLLLVLVAVAASFCPTTK